MTDPTAVAVPAPPERDTAALVLLIVGSLFGIFFLYQVGGGLLTWLVIGELEVTPGNVGMFRTITMVSQLVFILAPTLLLARWSGLGWKRILPMRFPGIAEAALAVLGLLSLQRVLEMFLYFQSLIPIPEFIDQILGPIKTMLTSMMMTLVKSDSPMEFVGVLLVVAIVPSITEEAYFRGLLQVLFQRVTTPVWGVMGSGIIFGLFHVNPFDAIGLVGLGVFLSYTRYRSASIIVPALLHFFNNGLAVVAVGAGIQEEQLFAESLGQAPTIGVALGQGTLFLALFVVVMRLYHRVTEPVRNGEGARP